MLRVSAMVDRILDFILIKSLTNVRCVQNFANLVSKIKMYVQLVGTFSLRTLLMSSMKLV